ncbi:MAG: GIY-YIG nuclease family protein, partial [Planctomycetota bacterium]
SAGTLVHSFVEHEVRPMSVWPMDVTGLTKDQVLEQVEAMVRALPPRAIAQVRLSGFCTPATLRGSRFSATARSIRPDVLFTASVQAVEFAPQRVMERWSRPTLSAFAHLYAPAQDTVRTSVENLRRLPTGCGVYAMHDAAGRLLYIGKANNVRARVRAHLRGKTGTKFFSGWTGQITRVETRLADSELEALLIEAELIRTLRPPFNRQMRRWTDYCYLSENGKPYGQLDVCRQPGPGSRCFGPFRSVRLARSVRDAVAEHFGLALCPDEQLPASQLPLLSEVSAAKLCGRYYRGLCSGPCAKCMQHGDYDRRIRQRDALLRGEDDASLSQFETRLQTAEGDMAGHTMSGDARTLGLAFEHCTTLREAEGLVHGLLLLPGPKGCRKTAMFTPHGIHLDALADDRSAAARILAKHRPAIQQRSPRRSERLPTAAVDGLCVAARQLRRGSGEYRFIPQRELTRADESTLLAVAFQTDHADGLASAEDGATSPPGPNVPDAPGDSSSGGSPVSRHV